MFLSALGIEVGEVVIGLGSIGIISSGIYASVKGRNARKAATTVV